MDCSLPGCSVLGILQTRILEWVAISSSRGFSWPLDGSNSGQRELVQPEFWEGHLCGMEENIRVRVWRHLKVEFSMLVGVGWCLRIFSLSIHPSESSLWREVRHFATLFWIKGGMFYECTCTWNTVALLRQACFATDYSGAHGLDLRKCCFRTRGNFLEKLGLGWALRTPSKLLEICVDGKTNLTCDWKWLSLHPIAVGL